MGVIAGGLDVVYPPENADRQEAVAVLLAVATARVGRQIFALLVALKIVKLLQIDEIGLRLVVIVEDPPEGCQPLLAVE